MRFKDDALIPDPVVWEKYGVTPMTGWRWTRDPKLNFPRPLKIKERNYRLGRELNEFDERLLREAIVQRAQRHQAAA